MMKRLMGAGVFGMAIIASSGFAMAQNEALPEGITGVPTMSDAVRDAAGALGVVPAGTEDAPVEKAEAGDEAPVIMSDDFVLGSVVGQTSRVGEELLILQQRKRLLDEIGTTMSTIGFENTLRMYPEYADYIETSPMALESQLARLQTLNQLREEVAKANGPTEYEKARLAEQAENGTAAQASGGGESSTDLMSMAVSDGQAPQSSALTRDDVTALIEEARQREAQEQMLSGGTSGGRTTVYGLTLAEVYGANGQMFAVLTDGDSTYKVQVGDDIPDAGDVTMITSEGVTLTQDGQETLIELR